MISGLQKRNPIEDVTLDDWNMLHAVMLNAPFHLTKLTLPDMKKKGEHRHYVYVNKFRSENI